MPNIKSAKKRVELTQDRAQKNNILKTTLKTALKKANAAIEANSDDKEVAVKLAVKKIDQAVAKGLLHKNTAARKKSQFTRKLNSLNA